MNGSTSEDEILRLARETRDNWESAEYYADAERHMERQWSEIIWPAIRDCDFGVVLELGPGHGRNSDRLLDLAGELHLVDVNESCIEQCRRRFEGDPRAERLHLHVNDGSSLSAFAAGSCTLVYSWDAMVHFEPPLFRRYLEEFHRVLRPGGRAALHFSNYGALASDPGGSWLENPHWRSAMSFERFQEDCAELGFELLERRFLDWDGMPALDCAALIRR